MTPSHIIVLFLFLVAKYGSLITFFLPYQIS